MKHCAKSSYTERLVVRHYDTSKRHFAPKCDVASTLPLNNKTNSLESFDKTLAGKIRRELGHYETSVTSTYSLPSSAGIGSPAARMSSR